MVQPMRWLATFVLGVFRRVLRHLAAKFVVDHAISSMTGRHVYAVVGLVAGTLLVLGCGDRESPVEPTTPVQATPPPVAPAVQDFRLSGAVSDTANRPLAGSKVEVMEGPRAGTFATTDESGRFSMAGTFTGNITLSASKDGYERE